MKKIAMVFIGILAGASAAAESLVDVDKFICSSALAQVCFESGECFAMAPMDLDMPEFVIFDMKAKMISTTKASGLNRSSEFSSIARTENTINLQGIEGEKLFSFVINEKSGYMTATIANDGYSVTVFGDCTDADVE